MKKLITASFVFGLLLVPSPSLALATLDPVRLNIIQQRCTLLQTVLGQLQRSDLVARTNRGREYESTAKQLDAFNQRLRHNNISTAALDQPLVNFKAMLEAFRTNYEQYDNAMSLLTQIDCQTRAADFASQLERTAIMRRAVGVEVTKGESYLAAYRQGVVSLQAELDTGNGGGQ